MYVYTSIQERLDCLDLFYWEKPLLACALTNICLFLNNKFKKLELETTWKQGTNHIFCK